MGTRRSSVGLGVGITIITTLVVFVLVQEMTDATDAREIVTGEAELVMIPLADFAVTAPQEQQSRHIPLSAFTKNGSPILGSESAPITLVEFGDYQCHFCNVFFHDTMPLIRENYIETGKVKMIFKDNNIIGPDSIEASHGAHCAGSQGMFWEYHDTLYTQWNGENTGWAAHDNLRLFAEGVQGIDIDKWSSCMKEKPYSATILASNADADTLSISGTPTFFVIGPDGPITPVVGAKPYASFAAILDAKIAAAGGGNNIDGNK